MRSGLVLVAFLLAGNAFSQESDTSAETATAASSQAQSAAQSEPLKSIAEVTAGATHHPGFMDLYYDPAKGRALLRIDDFESDLLYLVSLVTGIGSNDIGMDRGRLGDTRVVFFRRSGPKVLLVERNLKFRAETDNPGERRAVDEAFAVSVLAGFEVAAESDGGVLVDVTGLLTSDAFGIGDRLAAVEEGSYSVDASRSAPDPEGMKAFPLNTVLEAWVTLAGSKPGPQLRSVVPTPQYVTVRLRHQFIALPEPGFERRAFHPRSGYFSRTYRDYAAPITEPVNQHLLVRHRLQKKDPGQSRSEAVEPLVYYVDSGAPEPVRQALMDGARWWNDAFEAAGWVNAFQVRVLPADADPLDLRYNAIQWVHRETRGWSYGWGVIDPRTGEILKGHVTLGSLRVRQDLLIAEALTAPYDSGDPADGEDDAALNMALARLRQLSAHEIGHTLGLAHNFAASSNGDASVMDYPHPAISLDPSGQVSLDNAYATGMSQWDKLAIAYGYTDYASAEEERRGSQRLLDQAREAGLRFVSDPDARGLSAAHAGAHLWDNGRDPIARFDELMAVRRAALDRFSGAVLREGRPWAELERALVPVYLVHRYQAEAVARLIGGLEYEYALRGPDDGRVEPVGAARQKAALEALLGSLAESELTLAPEILARLQPPAYGDRRDRETFSHLTGNPFDALAPARAAVQLVAEMVLNPARVQRVAQQQGGPGLEGLLGAYSERLILPVDRSGDASLRAEIAWVALRELQRLAVEPGVSDAVRAATLATLRQIAGQLRRGDQSREMAAEIGRFLEEPESEKLPARVSVPPGAPI